jgi:hypothetical protein
MIKCFKCELPTEIDYMVELGIISRDRAMCEPCKIEMGKRIEEAMKHGLSPFRDMSYDRELVCPN